jgi:uncharacterized membrane protein YeaQ/YmgE (transglycosylase-associated protein family)
MQSFISQPGVGFFMMLIIGAIAGIIAEKVTNSDHGIFTNILVGLGGAFVGRELAQLLNIQVFGFLSMLVAAAVGATLILFIWRKVRG